MQENPLMFDASFQLSIWIVTMSTGALVLSSGRAPGRTNATKKENKLLERSRPFSYNNKGPCVMDSTLIRTMYRCVAHHLLIVPWSKRAPGAEGIPDCHVFLFFSFLSSFFRGAMAPSCPPLIMTNDTPWDMSHNSKIALSCYQHTGIFLLPTCDISLLVETGDEQTELLGPKSLFLRSRPFGYLCTLSTTYPSFQPRESLPSRAFPGADTCRGGGVRNINASEETLCSTFDTQLD